MKKKTYYQLLKFDKQKLIDNDDYNKFYNKILTILRMEHPNIIKMFNII